MDMEEWIRFYLLYSIMVSIAACAVLIIYGQYLLATMMFVNCYAGFIIGIKYVEGQLER